MHRVVNRRTALSALGVVALGCGSNGSASDAATGGETLGSEAFQSNAPPDSAYLDWDDPAAWPNGIPASGTDAIITRPIRLARDVIVDHLTIDVGGSLKLDPSTSVVLACKQNAVVHGRLVMRPINASVTHTLQFIGPSGLGVDESSYVGGGMEVLESDIGLWVENDGVLEAQGTPRAGWNRTGDDPTWLTNDETLSAPVNANDYTFHAFTPGTTVPSVQNNGVTYNTEVVNLTRNVVICGKPKDSATGPFHRAHVMFLHCTAPQLLSWVLFQDLGPRQGTAGVAGRYGVHFHHCADGVRGTTVVGALVRRCGNRAFVPHASHGITFQDCIGYEVDEECYWWDPDSGLPLVNGSNDITYLHCAAFNGHFDAGAFNLAQGVGNSCIDCVVAGNLDATPSCGFLWNATNNLKPSTWTFQDCVAHNNKSIGLRTWEIDTAVHLIERYVGYRNLKGGLQHGSYGNRFHFLSCVSFANGPMSTQALSQGTGFPIIERCLLDATGSPTASPSLAIGFHTTSGALPVQIIECRLMGWNGTGMKAVLIREREEAACLLNKGYPSMHDFIANVVVEAGVDRDLEVADFAFDCVQPTSKFRVQRRNGSCYFLNGDGTTGTLPDYTLRPA